MPGRRPSASLTCGSVAVCSSVVVTRSGSTATLGLQGLQEKIKKSTVCKRVRVYVIKLCMFKCSSVVCMCASLCVTKLRRERKKDAVEFECA